MNIINNDINNNKFYSTLYNECRSNHITAFYDFSFHMLSLFSTCTLIYFFKDVLFFSLPLTFILGLLHMKSFVCFHDCGHNSYTPSKKLNQYLGTFLGIITLNPFSWNFNHNTHHITSGNRNNKYNYKFNETVFHTVEEYNSWSCIKKKTYRVLMHPITFLFVLSPFKMIFFMRFNAFRFLFKKKSVDYSNFYIFCENIINNFGIYMMLRTFIYYEILLYFMMSYLITSAIGVSLFHNQHTYNPEPYIVSNNDEWNQQDSGVKGSSFIQIPWFFTYFTAGIEYHHIHHMNSKIPSYNLPKYHNAVVNSSNIFDNIKKLTIKECYYNLWLKLYDEDNNRYVTFNEIDRPPQ